MASVNKVIILGNLGADPETRTFPSGGQVCNVRIATTERWKDRQSGEQKEITEWHNVVFNDRLAEIAGQYLRKGSPVYVEGSLRTRKWTDKDGNDRYTTEIVAESMQLLGGRESMGGGDEAGGGYARPEERGAPAARPAPTKPAATKPATKSSPTGFDDMDDDIPF